MDVQLQRALNLEAFDAAKQIRAQREQVDAAVAKLEESKQGRSGTATSSNTDVRDTVSEGLLLRSELQRAVESEDYAEAAKIRDQLANLEEGASKLASSLESQREDQPQQMYQLGQRFVHAQKVTPLLFLRTFGQAAPDPSLTDLTSFVRSGLPGRHRGLGHDLLRGRRMEGTRAGISTRAQGKPAFLPRTRG
jgi:hypothetical protein